jgi:hypothetical protein
VYGAPTPTRARLLDAYSDLIQRTAYSAELYLIHIEGHGGPGPTAALTVTMIPTPGRLAVISREAW